MTAAKRYDPHLGAANFVKLGRGHSCGGESEFARQPVDDFLICVGVLGVRAVLVVPRAAHEVRGFFHRLLRARLVVRFQRAIDYCLAII